MNQDQQDTSTPIERGSSTAGSSVSGTALNSDLGQKSIQDLPRVRELGVAPQNLINYTLDHAMSLSVILACERTHPWFYESYVQLYSIRVFRRLVSGFHDMVRESELRGDEQENVAIHFAVMSGRRWFDECLAKKFMGDDPDDIISFIANSINRGCYLRLEADEFYLPNKRSFGVREWVHPTLVYGYDYDQQIVRSLGFDTQQNFTRLTFAYDDLRRAYASARRISADPAHKKSLVSLIKMWEPPRRYPFSRTRFLKELRGYLSGTIDSARKFGLTTFLPADVEVDSVLRWGVKVYEHFEIGLQHVLLGNAAITYVPVHALYEHKRFLVEAFRFVISEYQYSGKLVELADEFQKVVRAFHSMRWKFLRYELAKDPQLIREILEQSKLAIAEERQLLEQFCVELESSCHD